MARIRTIGFEIGLEEATFGFGDGAVQTGTVTLDTTTKRSGAKSLRCNSGAGNAAATHNIYVRSTETTLSGGTKQFVRAFFRVDALPSSTVSIMGFFDDAGTPAVQCQVALTSGGKVQLLDEAGVQIGSDSAATVAVDTWYMLELAFNLSAAGNDDVEARLDGVSVAADASNALSANPTTLFRLGWFAAPGASKSIYFDDFAWNDTTGSSQTSWPGTGKVVYQRPISDDNRGNWTGGAGGTTNLFAALDNTPPTGLAIASATDTSQIKVNTGTPPQPATFNLETYTTAGIVSGDTIVVVHPLGNDGEEIATGTKTVTYQVTSNPAGSESGNFNAGDNVGACGTWPANWRTHWAPPVYSPSVTLGTSPIVRVNRSDAAARFCDCDALGLYTEYTEAGVRPPPPTVANFAPTRAYTY